MGPEVKWAWEDANTPENPQPEPHFQISAAQSAADDIFEPSIRPIFEPPPEPDYLDAKGEIDRAAQVHREFNESIDRQRDAERRRRQPILGSKPELPPASDKTKRPHPRTMTKAEQVAEIVEAWPKLNAHETAAVLGALRRCPSIAGRMHVSKMAKATRGQHLVHQSEAAKLLGIKTTTLHQWAKKGWIMGKVKVSNNVWYPKTEVTKARKLAEKRNKT